MCVDCPMRKCGMEKKSSHCAECNDYPCQYIEDYVPIESDNRKALEEISPTILECIISGIRRDWR